MQGRHFFQYQQIGKINLESEKCKFFVAIYESFFQVVL